MAGLLFGELASEISLNGGPMKNRTLSTPPKKRGVLSLLHYQSRVGLQARMSGVQSLGPSRNCHVPKLHTRGGKEKMACGLISSLALSPLSASFQTNCLLTPSNSQSGPD